MKRTILILTAAALLLLAGCAGGGEDAPSWQEQYDLGVRYLSDGNYEEAVIAFTAAIEIEPKRAEAYLGLADAYEAMGDPEAARRALTDALAVADDPAAIQERLDRLSEDGDASLKAYDSVAEWMSDDFVTLEEITVGGVPFTEADIYEAKDLLPPGSSPEDVYIHPDSSADYSVFIDVVEDTDTVRYQTIYLRQTPDSDTLTNVGYDGCQGSGQSFDWDIGVRGIHTGDSCQEALEALGFTAEGARRLSEEALHIVLDFPQQDFYLEVPRVQTDRAPEGYDSCWITLFFQEGEKHYSLDIESYSGVISRAYMYMEE